MAVWRIATVAAATTMTTVVVLVVAAATVAMVMMLTVTDAVQRGDGGGIITKSCSAYFHRHFLKSLRSIRFPSSSFAPFAAQC